MADMITSPRRRCGMVRGRLTRIERDIIKLEDKEGLKLSDQRKVKRFIEQAKKHDHDFEQRHVDVLNFIKAGDQAALDLKEAIFDKHMNRVSDIIKRLEQLEDLIVTTEPAMPHAFDKGDGHHEEEHLS